MEPLDLQERYPWNGVHDGYNIRIGKQCIFLIMSLLESH